MRLVLLALLLTIGPALAQNLSPLSPNANAPMPRCGPALDGQTMCRFGVIYECEYISPDSMDRRTGWRWKSDILLGCDADPAPADLPGGNQGGLPPGFTYAPQANPNATQANPNGAQTGQPSFQTMPNPRPYGRQYGRPD